jgi:uncharacterized membrane protein
MKYADVQKLYDLGLITGDQRQQIITQFDLKEDHSHFLAIISFIGGALVVGGLILLIASNWSEIPRAVKIAGGLLLMLGPHTGGWWLRDVRRAYVKTGEALHLIGSAMFLANIALIGQVYHLSARPPNAFLLWWAGIAALPWLLRSKAQHVLSLFAFALWFGFEINEPGSVLYFGRSAYQILAFALLGLGFVGFGYCLRRTVFDSFAAITEKFGFFIFHAFAFTLTWGLFFNHESFPAGMSRMFPLLAFVTAVLITCGVRRQTALLPQWRGTWTIALLGIVGLIAGQFYWRPNPADYLGDLGCYVWTVALFVFAFLQINVGLQLRSSFNVNVGVAVIAMDIIATYARLFGSMARTGSMFVVSGVFLILFGVYLEKKRRGLMRQINLSTQEAI